MSYAVPIHAPRRALADVDAWDYTWAHALSPDEVYVLRLHVRGAELRDAADALLFARAGGQGQNLALDVRGVAIDRKSTMASDEENVDIILTTSASRLGVLWADNAADMAKKVAADLDLRRTFPGLVVDSPVFGRLTAPPDAVDHWRSQPMLWDHNLPGPQNLGGPTDAMAQPADYNVVKGRADDGKKAVPWKIGGGGLGPSPPGGDNTIWWVTGGAVVIGVAAWALTKEKGHRR